MKSLTSNLKNTEKEKPHHKGDVIECKKCTQCTVSLSKLNIIQRTRLKKRVGRKGVPTVSWSLFTLIPLLKSNYTSCFRDLIIIHQKVFVIKICWLHKWYKRFVWMWIHTNILLTLHCSSIQVFQISCWDVSIFPINFMTTKKITTHLSYFYLRFKDMRK